MYRCSWEWQQKTSERSDPRLYFYVLLINNNEYIWQKECNQSNRAHYLFKCFSVGNFSSLGMCVAFLVCMSIFMFMWNICQSMVETKKIRIELSHNDDSHENGFWYSSISIFFWFGSVSVSLMFSKRNWHFSFEIALDLWSTFCVLVFFMGWFLLAHVV